MSFFSALLSQRNRLLDSEAPYIEISGAYTYATTTQHNTNNLRGPRCLWYEGKTFFIFPAPMDVLPYGKVRIAVFDEQAGFDRIYWAGQNVSTAETHQFPAMAIDDSGVIHIVQENPHTTPLDRYKGGADTDYNLFLKDSAYIGTSLAYPWLLRKSDGNFVVFSRGTNDFDIYVTEASSGMDTWGSQRKITDSTASTLLRHYPQIPFGHGYKGVGGKFHLVMCARTDDGIVNGDAWWHDYYYVTTPDSGADSFYIFTNKAGTFSHDTRTDGDLTDAILQTNYRFYNHATNVQGFEPVTGITPAGSFYAIQGNSTENGYNFIYWNGSAFATRAISIANLNPISDYGTTYKSPFAYIIAFSSSDIRIIVDILVGSDIRQKWFFSDDEGQTWVDNGYVIDEVVTDNPRVNIPNNFLEIPVNRNFGMFFTLTDSVNPSFGKMLCKTYAWGSIQSIPGLTITPASSFSRATGNLFHYKAVDADMTRSGTDVLTLVDKFGLRDATGVNNPQWDGVDEVYTNGTNNYFTLDGVAGLAAVKTFTFMVVCRVTFQQNTFIITFCDNTDLETFEIHLCQTTEVGYNVATFNRDSANNNVRVYGQDRVDDGTLHLVTVCVDGTGKADIYVDGKMQWFQTTANTSQKWNYIGDSPWNYATVNSVRIGSRDSTTDAFTAVRFAEMVGYSEILPLPELREKMKKLCDDYGITYQNQFQIPA